MILTKLLLLLSVSSLASSKCNCDQCSNLDITQCTFSQHSCGGVDNCPDGHCICNMWGCNCDGCSCTRRLGFLDQQEEGECDDFDEYMAMPADEQREQLSIRNCHGESLAVKDNIHDLLLEIADTNGDGELSCEEFNNGYHNVPDDVRCDTVTSDETVDTANPSSGGTISSMMSASLLVTLSWIVVVA